MSQTVAKTLDFAGFASRVSACAVGPGRERRLHGGDHGVEQVYEWRLPQAPFTDLLIFYHGGGAHRRAGYTCLGETLARDNGIAVCLPDLRGHGASGGQRGHAPGPRVIWDDIDKLIDAVGREFPGARIHLGGHSSGAGLLLNYMTLRHRSNGIASLVLLAPEFGFHAGVYRDRRKFGSFARVSVGPFLLAAFSGGRLGNGISAVHFDYGKSKPTDGCLTAYTVGMAHAVTPVAPARQIGMLDIPTMIGLPENDELVDTDRLEIFLQQNARPNIRWKRLSGSGHLDVILDAAPFVAASLSDAHRLQGGKST